MKYHVATNVSVLVGALLIVAAFVQTRHADEKNSALRAHLSALSIDQLTMRFWECQPPSPGEPYKRDVPYCAEVNNTMTSRASEVAPLQVVKIQPNFIDLPDFSPGQLQQISAPSSKRHVTIPVPSMPKDQSAQERVFPSTAAG